ncbi:cupin domain-containing protein [Candidatus Woesearchaeota archaeon]|nr:cupin domain-containing protein [Candidatus Woesearchaeota archaeon]
MQPAMIRVQKGWGHELWIVNKPEYCGKLLFFEKGKQLSWHYHRIKDETFYVQSGKVLLKYADHDDIYKAAELVLSPGQQFHVRPGLRHRLIGLEESEVFEFSTQHFDEDSIRIQKGD